MSDVRNENEDIFVEENEDGFMVPGGDDKPVKKGDRVIIKPPKFGYANIAIVGDSPYVQHKFSRKALLQMEETQRAGPRARVNTRREVRDLESEYLEAAHVSTEGWYGAPAPGFRNAMISACKISGFAMTRAKMSIFVLPDGLSADDNTPLVRIYGEPICHQGWGRIANGNPNLIWRPMWTKWRMVLQLKWDSDQFTVNDIANLLSRAGQQVGIGEGRHDSPKSNGMGWGCFRLESEADEVPLAAD